MLKETTFLTGPDKADTGFVKGRYSVFHNIPFFSIWVSWEKPKEKAEQVFTMHGKPLVHGFYEDQAHAWVHLALALILIELATLGL
jgi:hypothetical protein